MLGDAGSFGKKISKSGLRCVNPSEAIARKEKSCERERWANNQPSHCALLSERLSWRALLGGRKGKTDQVRRGGPNLRVWTGVQQLGGMSRGKRGAIPGSREGPSSALLSERRAVVAVLTLPQGQCEGWCVLMLGGGAVHEVMLCGRIYFRTRDQGLISVDQTARRSERVSLLSCRRTSPNATPKRPGTAKRSHRYRDS